MKEKTTRLISWWQTTGTVQEKDSRAQIAGRRAVRIIGILLLFMVSPILVTALVFLAFVAVI